MYLTGNPPARAVSPFIFILRQGGILQGSSTIFKVEILFLNAQFFCKLRNMDICNVTSILATASKLTPNLVLNIAPIMPRWIQNHTPTARRNLTSIQRRPIRNITPICGV